MSRGYAAHDLRKCGSVCFSCLQPVSSAQRLCRPVLPAAWVPCCYWQPDGSVEACDSAPAPFSCRNLLKPIPVLLQPGDALPLLRVNFDPALVRLLREVRYFLLLSNLPMAVPDNALKVKCRLSPICLAENCACSSPHEGGCRWPSSTAMPRYWHIWLGPCTSAVILQLLCCT